MRHLPLLIVLSLAACGPVASSTDDTDAGPADAPTAAADVPTAGEADAASSGWTEWLCRAHAGRDITPWCSAAQPHDGAWCTLRDLRDGDTGLVPWSECLAYAVAGMPASLRPSWDRIAAAGCTYPPALCDIAAGWPACSGLRVYSGGSIQGLLGHAVARGSCWPRAL